ncbi:MAG: hypothetical protein WCE75_09435 [Terracidiphilus sp.]
MELTVQLAFKLAIVWAGGFLLAILVRAVLPEQAGFNFYRGASSFFVSFSRVGFWTCILAALTVTGLVVFRAMAADLARGALR